MNRQRSLFSSLFIFALSSCGAPPSESPLLDMADFTILDSPCALNTAQPNVAGPVVINYLCKAARAEHDPRLAYMELSPVSHVPEDLDVPLEIVDLTQTETTPTTLEFTGVSRSQHLRVRVSVMRSTNQIANNMATLVVGPTPFLVGKAPESATSPFCNDPAKIAPSYMRLPFMLGYRVGVTQGANGKFSHQNVEDTERRCTAIYYAFDFGVRSGTSIYAANSGTVMKTKEDSNMSCPRPECADQANYVLIRHNDGTVAYYYHLQYMGALVHVGQTVMRGQLIARSGGTGFTTGPHLHFEIRTPDNRYTVAPYFKTSENPEGLLLTEGNFYTTIAGDW